MGASSDDRKTIVSFECCVAATTFVATVLSKCAGGDEEEKCKSDFHCVVSKVRFCEHMLFA